jgi:hypothetical protein
VAVTHSNPKTGISAKETKVKPAICGTNIQDLEYNSIKINGG